MTAIKIPNENDHQLALFLSGIGSISTDDAQNAIASSEESGKGVINTLVQSGVTNELEIAN